MRVYVYGAFPTQEALPLLEKQLDLAHRYKNDLVRVERDRRARVDALVASLAPGLQAVEERVAALDAGVEAATKAAGMANSRRRSVGVASHEGVSIKTLKQQLAGARAERKALRAATFGSLAWGGRKGEALARAKTDGLNDDAKDEFLSREFLVFAPHVDRLRAAAVEADRGVRGALENKEKAAGDKAKLKDAKVKVKDAKKALSDAKKALSDATDAAEADPVWCGARGAIDSWARVEVCARRAARVLEGLNWGTYQAVDESMQDARKGAPPDFRSWRFREQRWAKTCVHIQDQPLSTDELLEGTDSRLRLSTTKRPGAKRGSRRSSLKLQGTLRFRVGSNPDRSPSWADVRLVVHRPLPPGAAIKGCSLVRRFEGSRAVWTAQFVVDYTPEQVVGMGTVAIDVGWRVRPDGDLRVASWVGSDGEEGELLLPRLQDGTRKHMNEDRSREARSDHRSWPEQYEKAEALRGDRASDFEVAKKKLAEHLKTDTDLKAHLSALIARPDKSKSPGVSHIMQWRSEGQLASLALKWRDARLRGDDEIYLAMFAWRQRDRHLWDYEVGIRNRLQGARREAYRLFACEMSRRYARAVLEDMDLSKFHVEPEREDDSPEIKQKRAIMKKHVRDACVSSLRECLSAKMPLVKCKPADTTLLCSWCGSREEWDHVELDHECSGCGRTWDQDNNAARNLLARASGSVVADAPAPLAPSGARI